MVPALADPSVEPADRWAMLDTARRRVETSAPDLLPLFDVYAEETRFAREVLRTTLAGLEPGARVLEVGAGTFMLSVLLGFEGFSVTAIEPHGSGFSDLRAIADIVLGVADD